MTLRIVGNCDFAEKYKMTMRNHRACVALLSIFLIANMQAADAVATSYPPIVQGSIQSQGGQGLAIDAGGNRYVVGIFSGAVDFNPLTGEDTKTSLGGNDVFVTRFNSDGSYG